MPDYKTMSAVEVLRLAKSESGKTVEQLSAETGIRCAPLRRYFSTDEDGDYLPSVAKLPQLISAFGNNHIINWIMAQSEIERLPITPAKSRAEVLTGAARAAASLGDPQRALAENEELGIGRECARKVRSQLEEARLHCAHAQAMLETLRPERKGRLQA